MEFPSTGLIQGILRKRYKRFLADIELEDQIITAHCPNTGSMRHCWEPGDKVWLSQHNNPKRKYPYTWELVERDGDLIGINTHRANDIVYHGLGSTIFENAQDIQREVVYPHGGSRVDFSFFQKKRQYFLEVKSVTLKENGVGYFPDAVSLRGQKHLQDLIKVQSLGAQGVLFFCVQHTGIVSVKPATHIDAEYSKWLHAAVDAGVQILAYTTEISPKRIALSTEIPFSLA